MHQAPGEGGSLLTLWSTAPGLLCVTEWAVALPPLPPARSASCLIRKLKAQQCPSILKRAEQNGEDLFSLSGTSAQALCFVPSAYSSPPSAKHTQCILLLRLAWHKPKASTPRCSALPTPLGLRQAHWRARIPNFSLLFRPPLQDCALVWALGRIRPFSVWGLFCRASSLPHSTVLSSSPARQNHKEPHFLSASFLLSGF